MKLDIKLFIVAVVCSATGFLASLTMVVPPTSEPSSPSTVSTGPMVILTQFQPEMVVLAPYHRPQRPPRQSMPEEMFDPMKEIGRRSLDLIDMRDRYQPRTDLKESGK